MEKYMDCSNLVVSIHINNIIVPNVLIDLGAIINVMKRQTMEQLQFPNLHPTPIVLDLTY